MNTNDFIKSLTPEQQNALANFRDELNAARDESQQSFVADYTGQIDNLKAEVIAAQDEIKVLKASATLREGNQTKLTQAAIAAVQNCDPDAPASVLIAELAPIVTAAAIPLVDALKAELAASIENDQAALDAKKAKLDSL